MNPVNIYRSAVDNQFYKIAGNPEMQRAFRNAGIVTTTDTSSIEAVTILDEVLGLARVKYNLRNVLRPITMDNLTMRVDVATSLAGEEKVPPLVESEIKKESYSAVNFDLWKNVVHVAVADETGMKAAHSILQMHVSDAARDLARMENKQIAEVLEANITEKVAGTAYSDWGAVTAGVSDTNPFIALIASMNYIEGKGYEPDFVAMHPTIFGKFIQNTYVKTFVEAGIASLASNGGNFTLPGYPTVKIVTDHALTETPTSSIGPIVGSSSAPGSVLGVGPTSAASYRNEKAGYNAYIIRQWLEPKVVLDDALDMICT